MRKWLIILLAIVSLMALATYTGVTKSFFVDDEPSTDDTLTLFIPQIVLDDSFEGTPWDNNWDGNGTTTWIQDTTSPHTGTNRAFISDAQTAGYLTSDDLDGAGTDIIFVSFWFNPKQLEAGDLLVEVYNGSTWGTPTNFGDLTLYPTYANNVWCQFNEQITDSQYFVGNFRIRFNASLLGGATEQGAIDDVQISTYNYPPNAPTGLAATLGDAEVDLDWDDNSEGDLEGYNVYRSTDSGGSPTPYTKVNGSLVATSDYTDTGLTNDVTYYYVVTAVDTGSNESAYSNEDSATPTDLPPAAPTTLVATSGDEEITLDWDDNTDWDLDGYNVYRSTDTGGSPTPYTKISGSLLATSDYTDTNLTYDVTYYYVVTAVDLTSNESDNSNEDNAIANNVAPEAPTGLAATPGDKEVDLDWGDNSEGDFDGYNVYRSTDSGGSPTPYTKLNGSLLTSSDYNDTAGLTNGTTYYYVVTAVDTYAAESNYSSEDSATPVNVPPVAPTGLVATYGNAEVDLDWDDNSESDLDGYNIYRSTDSGGSPTPYAKVNGSLVVTSDYTDTGLTNGTTYYYVVVAVDTDAAESSYSNEDSATPIAPIILDDGFEDTPWDDKWNSNGTTTWVQGTLAPHTGSYYAEIDQADTPGNLTSDDLDMSAASGISVNFWFEVKQLEAGDLLVEVYNGSTWGTPTGFGDLTLYPTYVNNVWCEFDEIISDSQYLISGFRIRFNASALGGATESANIDDLLIVADTTPPGAPTGLVTTPGNSHVDLDWDDNSEGDLDGYNVYRSTDSGGSPTPYAKVNGSLVTSSDYDDTGLTNETTYYYVVTAVDLADNESDFSGESSATPTALVNLIDGFEGTPWDLYWDDNGATSWVQDIVTPHTGTYDAHISDHETPGYLTTDDIDASASTSISVNFWFYPKALEAGDLLVEVYNGSTWGTPGNFGDLTLYSTYANNVWCQFNEQITDSQYHISDFRLRINASTLGGAVEQANIDDVLIITDSIPPNAPTGLAATLGDAEVDLDWNDNSEGDLDGYNVYRSTDSGGSPTPYTKVNGSLVATSDYTDTSLTNGTTYYYVVTAVDYGTNESGNSNEDSAIPTDAAPAVPTGLLATTGDEEISLDWDDNTDWDIDGYNVYRSTDSGGSPTPYTKINGSLVATSNYTDTGLYGGGTYYYVVTAVDLGTNESDNSNEDSATANDVAPTAPTGLAATLGDEEISLDWDDNSESDLDGYNVYRSTDSGGSPTPYTKINGSLVVTSDYTDTGLYGGGTY
ncbi:fibronectin type III domain-containing protein, partial [Chloroflexota bacterium]